MCWNINELENYTDINDIINIVLLTSDGERCVYNAHLEAWQIVECVYNTHYIDLYYALIFLFQYYIYLL